MGLEENLSHFVLQHFEHFIGFSKKLKQDSEVLLVVLGLFVGSNQKRHQSEFLSQQIQI